MFPKRKKRIDFLIAGAQKAGTTALDAYLRKHPEIKMGRRKEIHFFDNEEYFVSKNIDYSIYHKNFPKLTDKKIFGESTPIYFFWYPCLERIYEYNPKIKIIVILRNPIARAYSHWNMEYLRNDEKLPFNMAIQKELNRTRQHRVKSYTQRGLYARQILNAQRIFKKEQLFYIKYEDFLENQNTILEKVFEFLKISNSKYKYEPIVANQKTYSGKISTISKNFLIEYFSHEIEEVEKLLDWDCSDWKNYDLS